MNNINISNNIHIWNEPQFLCSDLTVYRLVKAPKASPSWQPAELAPCLGEVCSFLPSPAPATCGAASAPPRPRLAQCNHWRSSQTPCPTLAPCKCSTTAVTYSPRGLGCSWALVGPRNWVTWSGADKGVSRAPHAQSAGVAAQRGQLGARSEFAPAASASSFGPLPSLSLMSCTR